MIYEETRPWGKFEVLLDAPDCKVKRITINPGQSPSYQYHFKRDEIWTIVSGNGTLKWDIVGSSSEPLMISLYPQKSTTIQRLCLHQVKNTSKTEPLVFIETQLGEYFGEDDIVRVEDNYGRV
jgi:mannose-6-phosphate isomerase